MQTLHDTEMEFRQPGEQEKIVQVDPGLGERTFVKNNGPVPPGQLPGENGPGKAGGIARPPPAGHLRGGSAT